MTNVFARMRISLDRETLAAEAADWLMGRARAGEGMFAVSLAGGTTPRRLYELLAAPPRRDAFPWARAHWFWGDERFTPHDDPRSNYRMAWDALLSRAPVPRANIHPIPTEGVSPDAAARAYERELMAFYGADRLDPDRALFDATLLGLGADGHTASLFPGGPALDERTRWVAAVEGAAAETRVTLTFPALASSRAVAFLVAGPEKREALARLRAGDPRLPAARVRPHGPPIVFADASAVAPQETGR